MALALLDAERKVITAALKFANLRYITSAEQVEKLFEGIKGPVFQSVEENYEDYIKNDQPKLRGWLDRITTSEAERGKVAKEVAPFLAEKLHVFPVLQGRRLRFDYQVDGVEAACALAVALILDEGRKLTSRLQCCGWCKRLRLDLDPRGRPRKFCSVAHKQRFDLRDSARRVREWRKNKARTGSAGADFGARLKQG